MIGEAITLLKNIFPSSDENKRAVNDPEQAREILLSAAQIVKNEKIMPKDIDLASTALVDKKNPDWKKARIFIWGPMGNEEKQIFEQGNPGGSGLGAIRDLRNIMEKMETKPKTEDEIMTANNWYHSSKVVEAKERPPKKWWDDRVSDAKKQYPDYSDERISQIVGGIWQNYDEATRKKLRAE
jgi:hypothetical protein